MRGWLSGEEAPRSGEEVPRSGEGAPRSGEEVPRSGEEVPRSAESATEGGEEAEEAEEGPSGRDRPSADSLASVGGLLGSIAFLKPPAEGTRTLD